MTTTPSNPVQSCQPSTAEAKSEKTHILWATNMDDEGYADVLFLVGDEPPYGVGINCGGHVIVKPLREWHALGASAPEASFDNASDMLGYLNASREAEPVTPITNPLVLPAGIKAGDYASPSPIPDAPVVREGEIPERETWWLVEREGTGLYSTGHGCYPGWSNDPWRAARFPTARAADNARLLLAANDLRDQSVATEHIFINKMPRALKPQDGGNCEHGIAKVNCGICVPSEVFSKPQDGGESGS